MSSCGDFNSEFDTYLLTGEVLSTTANTLQRILNSRVYVACSCTQISSVWISLDQKEKARQSDSKSPLFLWRSACSLRSASIQSSRTSRADRRGVFLMVMESFMHKYITSIPLTSSNCLSQTALCHLSPHTHARPFFPQPLSRPTFLLPHSHSRSRLLLP